MKLFIVDASTEALSPRRAKLLQFLASNTGQKLNVFDIMKAIGWESPAPLLSCLNRLEECGKIRRAS